MNKCLVYGSIKEERKEEINLSKSSPRDLKSEREERLFST